VVNPGYNPRMQPPPPIDVVDLFPDERALLLDLLASLSADEWAAPTVCAPWSVKDLAAHIVADDLGVVSRGRDGYGGGVIDVDSYEALVAAINEQNEQWVRAMRRLSTGVITELLRVSGDRALAQFRSRDLNAIGDPVNWAGPEPAPVWLDIAREYTERWAHQQQIRDAVNKPGLKDRRFFAPLLDAYVRGAPHAFRATAAPDGTHVRVEITGEAGGASSLVRSDGRWALYTGVETPPHATTTLDQETAWRLFTKGVTPETAREHATLLGEASLAAQVLSTVSVLA
jgi:uncharacterized protein (TIGR03083 family)